MTGSTRIYVGHLPYDVRAEEIEKFFEKIAPVKDMMVKSDKGYAFVEYDSSEHADDAIRTLNDADFNGSKIMVKPAYAKKERSDGPSRRDDYGRRDDYRDGDRGRGSSNGDRYRDDRRDYDDRRRRDDYDDRRRDDRPPVRRDYDDRRRDYDDRPPRRDYEDRPPRRDYDDRKRDYDDRRDDRRRDDGGSRGRFERPRNTKWRVIVEGLPRGTNWQDLKDFFRKAGEVTYADVRRDRDDEGVADFATHEDLLEAIRTLDGTELRGQKVFLREDKSHSGDKGDRDSGYERRAPRELSASPPPPPPPRSANEDGGEGW
ncbi:hypothetical protein MP638_006953 [Amoeboaphelidium occidentale]|nr:hypothetical protein MP638_006953 [Amoeboaphelidium occidentale]